MVEGDDERRIEYNMISEELWWDERRMHGSAEMREKQAEPQLRSSGNAGWCKELEKAGGAIEYLIDVPLRRAHPHHAHARIQHIHVPDRKADHKRDRRVASGSARSGVAMVRTHAMELVARGKRVTWCELVRVNEDRGKALDEQGSRTHMKIGPGAGENGRKDKRDAPDERNAGAGTGMG
ncbi:hypothetical protein B0H14DRAFT_2612559 [Mycena olivaceomarginata]|nr:hypothetical protein B0H14DRAFT_2612559 [Mycena olivaceomarginata]